jgi:hypothetical protein
MSDFDISKVRKLTREDLENPKTPPLTLEGLKNMCNYLDEENPATYEIFLKYRPDLSVDEVAYYRDIIDTLKENEKIKREYINSRMRGFEEVKDGMDEVSVEIK